MIGSSVYKPCQGHLANDQAYTSCIIMTTKGHSHSDSDHDSTSPEDTSLQLSPSQSSFLSDSHKPKRVRVNHNEIERKRRNAQKARLEELRQVIPMLSGQDRASTVNIIVNAKDYIEQLKGRVADLERFVHSVQGVAGQAKQLRPSSSQHQATPILPNVPGYTPIAPVPNQNHPALLLAEAASSLPAIERPVTKGPSQARIAPHRLDENNPTIANLSQAMKRRSSSSGDDFLALLQARKSSLILPAEDGVYFGKRSDSIHNFLTSGLNSVLEENIQADIRCAKCSRGINSLIMVDCDRCHSWYHIRCVGLDAHHIPVSWKCPEC